MSVTANAVLEFVRDLLRRDSAAVAYRADPRAALAAAGLAELDPGDLAALGPAIAESAALAGDGRRLAAILGGEHPRTARTDPSAPSSAAGPEVWARAAFPDPFDAEPTPPADPAAGGD